MLLKKYLVILIALCLPMGVWAQKNKLDRSKAPKAGEPPKVEIKEAQTFQLANGLKVFVVENHKIPRVAFSLVLDLPPIKQGNKAGLFDIFGQMMQAGTTTRTKDQIDEEIDFMGASLNISSSSIYAESLKKHADKTVEIMADVLLNPSFPEAELEKFKKQAVSGIKSSKDSPEAIAGNISKVLNYGDHPFGEVSTEATLESISVNDCRSYYQTYFRPNGAYLAIVGDITLAEAQALMQKYLDKWPKGEIPKNSSKSPETPQKNKVALAQKTGAVQSYIVITYPVELVLGSSDYIKAAVMSQLLGGQGGRLYLNLREDKGYTYGAYSSLSQNKYVGQFTASASVRTAVTDSAISQFMYELKRLRDIPVDETELKRVKSIMAGSFARSTEQAQTIASMALNTARYNLPTDYYRTYLQKLNAITAMDIQEAAKKFLRPDNANIVVVGDAQAVAEKLKPFGQVIRYDFYGKEEKAIDPAILQGMTAEKVLQKYIEKIGGAAKVKEVKSFKQTLEMEFQGMKVQMDGSIKSPDKIVMLESLNGTVFNKRVFDGKQGFITGMQGNKELEGQELESLKYSARLFPELNYSAVGLKPELTGAEVVEGQPAYEVTFTSAQGTKNLLYFDVNTGLKIKEVIGEQPVVYDNYKEVKGVLFPHTWKISAQGVNLEGQVVSIEVNPKLEDSLFVK